MACKYGNNMTMPVSVYCNYSIWPFFSNESAISGKDIVSLIADRHFINNTPTTSRHLNIATNVNSVLNSKQSAGTQRCPLQ